MKEDFALKHYSKVLLKEAMTAMLVYHQRKLAKKNMYRKALEDRKTKQLQTICFKVLLVGRYWSEQSIQRQQALSETSFAELRKRIAFIKWKNQALT